MAISQSKLFLSKNDTVTVFDTVKILGASGDESIKLGGNVGASIDQGIERVEFREVINNYTFSLAGNVLNVSNNGNLTASITIQGDGTKLAFNDGSADFLLTGLSAGKLGGAFVSNQDKAVTGANLDTFDPSVIASLNETAGVSVLNVNAEGIDNSGNDSQQQISGSDISIVFEQGSYTYDVIGFSAGDQLNFADKVSLSVENSSGTDGKVIIHSTDPNTGTTADVILSGLNATLDQTIFSVDSFKSAFGNDALFVGNATPPGGSAGGNGNGNSGGSISIPKDVSIDGTGTDNSGDNNTENVATANVTLKFATGNYDYTVENFSSGDHLDFVDSAAISIVNTAVEGDLEILVADTSSGSVATIKLLGLALADDKEIFSVDSFNAQFAGGLA